ncbi:Chloroplast protein HCF243 [Quillaja saponaria]|uniref:Chloroplast protein HCF243 n=1 Tax=Quillaja saponaria TaxID=32244 RepID=A0AAD7VNA7_QUISA|nr:Chloroplast protein HCF243 [Quillaja saponaria]
MDSESRPQRTTSSSRSTSELFICFTSRLSSSSMKLSSSKSIRSPGRSREPSQISLSTSLNRKIRSNGSMKGEQASPMFPSGGKKKGCAFENPEPSSPKVTCIGQVRVKTMKQGKKMRSKSKRIGEASFRKTEQNAQVGTNPDLNQQKNQFFQYHNHQNLQQECLPHRNQRWVHIPLTICEALRTFGAEFNCFLPCRSSCMSRQKVKEEKAVFTEGSNNGGRWLVSVQEVDGKGREIELVVGEEERTEMSQRTHIFEEIEIKEENRYEGFVEEEEKARVSICIPPKNALLLMRCRSDPVKMAALANRFWESPQKDEEEHGDNDEEEHKLVEQQEEEQERQSKIEPQIDVKEKGVSEKELTFEASEQHQIPKTGATLVAEVHENDIKGNPEFNHMPEANPEKQAEEVQEVEDVKEKEEAQLEEVNANQQEETREDVPSFEVPVDPEKLEIEEVQLKMLQDLEDEQKVIEDEEDDYSEQRNGDVSYSNVVSEGSELEDEETSEVEALAEGTEESIEEGEKETATQVRSEPNNPKLHENKVGPENSKELKVSQLKVERGSSALPDCLLLMMCEPKLSMEVSKETWVCSTDFIRWLPERPIKKDGRDEPKKGISIASNPPPQLLQPPRSSCSFPAPAASLSGISMATMIEQKPVGLHANLPFLLTRCKSEPRTSPAKLATEACFWKNSKLEPHRPTTLGVGAAGIGF